MPSILINLNEFPEAPIVDKKPESCYQIYYYLENLFELFDIKNDQTIVLPSMLSLAMFFNATLMDIHDAFQLLRKNYYDYQFKGLDHSIKFWHT